MNFAYELEGVCEWKEYNIGEGNLHTYSSLLMGKKLSSINDTVGAYSQPTVRTCAISSHTTTVNIPCTENGRSKVFRTQEQLTMHVAAGKHVFDPRETQRQNRTEVVGQIH